MKKLIVAALAGTLLAGAAACTDEGAGSSSGKGHAKHHTVKSRAVTAKAHIHGGSYLLTLKGARHPVAVSRKTYRSYGIGDKYPRK